MDYLRKYMSTNVNESQPSGAETVERLVDRVQSSTLIDDRRDAMRALKSLSKKFRLEVGTQAMHIVVDVLDKDRNDCEIVAYGLEIMHHVMSDDATEEIETNQLVNIPEDLGGQFTEMLIKKPENIQLLLSFVDEYDFHVRRHAVRLLIVLLSNRAKEMQEAVLMCPMGVSKLLDLLSDAREVVRNDGILLLTELTQGNTNIQKIVAFENVFDRVLTIVEEEGQSDGGVVVEDCLRLLLQLLKNNAPNQTLFKEGSFVQRITCYFELSADDTDSQKGWSAQKVANLQLMLQVVRTMVSPGNKVQTTRACQQVMHDCGLLPALCTILMASGVPAEVLTETIHTVAETVRGCPTNQNYLSGVMAPSEPPQPAITVLLMSMVNERQPFVLRAAVLYCFQCYLYENKAAQAQVVQTLLPKTAEVASVSAGQLLCGGLFSHDPLSAWFAAVALLHAVHNNSPLKEELLRVHLATTLGSRPVTLLQQCCNLLSHSIRYQAKVGLLMLLCTWLSNCPVVVRKFLTGSTSPVESNPGGSNTGGVSGGQGASSGGGGSSTGSSGNDGRGSNVLTLISEIAAVDSDETELVVRGLCALLLGVSVKWNPGDVKGYDSNSLMQTIERRVGIDSFVERLNQVPKVEAYTKAMKRPQPSYKQSTEVAFDYEFTRLFKFLEHEVVNAVQQSEEKETPEERAKKMSQFVEHENVVLQYKELIKTQDEELQKLRASVGILEVTGSSTDKEISRLKEELQKLRDQNVLLKASKGPSRTGSLPSLTDAGEPGSNAPTDKASPSPNGDNTNDLISRVKTLEEEIEKKNSELQKAHGEASRKKEGCLPELDSIRNEMESWKTKYEELQAKNTMNQDASGSEGSHKFISENSRLKEEISNLKSEVDECQTQLLEQGDLKAQLEQATHLAKDAEEERDNMKQEHEDLLVLLSEQDSKLSRLKIQLKELGGEVSEEEDGDEDEEDIEDDEN